MARDVDRPFEGGVFPILIDFPCDFRDEPPNMRFLSPMSHPNVRESGEICIAILRSRRRSPESVDVARTSITDKTEFVRKARRVFEQS
jgi:ubiquitin-protein ligase